jgi:hypothetical protein
LLRVLARLPNLEDLDLDMCTCATITPSEVLAALATSRAPIQRIYLANMGEEDEELQPVPVASPLQTLRRFALAHTNLPADALPALLSSLPRLYELRWIGTDSLEIDVAAVERAVRLGIGASLRSFHLQQDTDINAAGDFDLLSFFEALHTLSLVRSTLTDADIRRVPTSIVVLTIYFARDQFDVECLAAAVMSRLSHLRQLTLVECGTAGCHDALSVSPKSARFEKYVSNHLTRSRQRACAAKGVDLKCEGSPTIGATGAL